VAIEDTTQTTQTNPHLAIAGAILLADPPVTSPETRYTITAKGSKIDDPLAWPHKVTILFWENPFFYISLRDGVYMIEKWLVNRAGSWVLLLVSVIITAGFIPSMLAKGSLDLLISKPIGRTRLLLYKYIGGLTFVFLLTTITVVGVWLMIGLRSGIWSTNFLLIVPMLSFYFAVLYGVSASAAVFTRNTLVAILLTGLAWGSFWLIGKVNDGIEARREAEAAAKARGPNQLPPIAASDPNDPTSSDPLATLEPDAPLWGIIPKSVFPFATALHTITPRTYQLDDRLSRVIAEGVLTPYQLKKQGYDKPPRVSWGETIAVSLAFIGVVLGASAWRFETRDN
jgi:ABC-type transport system involved in multi-copper enzyme maturation permease subunit